MVEFKEMVVGVAIVWAGLIDKTAEKSDIGAGAYLEKEIGLGRRARKARIYHDHFGVAMQLRFHRPLETTRVVLSRVAAHNQHHVGVLDVDPAVGHCAASEGGPQTGDRWTVSNPGLRFEVADPQAAHRFDGEKIQFIGIGAATNPAYRFQTVDGVPTLIFVDESFVPGLLRPARNFIDRVIP